MTEAIPDTPVGASQTLSSEEVWRADFYDMLAALLARPPSAEILEHVKALTGDASDVGRGVDSLSRIAKALSAKAVEAEYNALFIGLGRGELLPYASFYLTGFLNEKPLARLRQDMSDQGIEREESVFEPEDHLATVMEIMAGMIRGRFGPPASLDTQKAFFKTHVGPWAGHAFSDLEGAKSSVFYAPVGTIGRVFMDVETEAFRMGGDS